MNRYCGVSSKIRRTQRHPQYSDEELKPFFAEVSKGYCFEQATKQARLDWQTMRNTLYGDDETMAYSLDLAMVAGALIRRGDLPIPDRWDRLYEKVRHGIST